MSKTRFAAIILAAGEGTRLKSATPKVLHQIAGWPMIRHVTEALRPLDPVETVVVLGPGMEAVARAVAPARPRCSRRRAPAMRCALPNQCSRAG
jgi:bifunctional UDP-N-acetylglucosamine pyrophosphorylase/glucosamine-1-phosphate N-acetyltransferase